MIDFNDMSTCLRLFYAKRLGNRVHCMFISNFFCVVVFQEFFFAFISLFISVYSCLSMLACLSVCLSLSLYIYKFCLIGSVVIQDTQVLDKTDWVYLCLFLPFIWAFKAARTLPSDLFGWSFLSHVLTGPSKTLSAWTLLSVVFRFQDTIRLCHFELKKFQASKKKNKKKRKKNQTNKQKKIQCHQQFFHFLRRHSWHNGYRRRK